MAASRHCPKCSKFALDFTARATKADPGLVEVIGQCEHCKYIFLHHFDFEEMLPEAAVTELLQKIAAHIAGTATPDPFGWYRPKK